MLRCGGGESSGYNALVFPSSEHVLYSTEAGLWCGLIILRYLYRLIASLQLGVGVAAMAIGAVTIDL